MAGGLLGDLTTILATLNGIGLALSTGYPAQASISGALFVIKLMVMVIGFKL